MQSITVRYVGKGDSILTEYDGVKYNFSKSRPVVTIPLAVYNNMQDYQNPHRESIVPYVEEHVKETPMADEQAKAAEKAKKKK